MIKLNVSKKDLNDDASLLKALGMALNTHIYGVQGDLDEKVQRYEGESSVTTTDSNNETTTEYKVNKAKYISDMATELFIGTLPDIRTISKVQAELKRMEAFNNFLNRNDFDNELFITGHNGSITGDGFMLAYSEDGETEPRFASCDPRFSNIVYDCFIKPHPLFAFTYNVQVEKSGSEQKTYYRIYCYTDKYMFTVDSLSAQFPELNWYKTGFTKIEHHFGDIPMVEFPNNDRFAGDFDPVTGYIDAYNALLNGRITNINQAIANLLMIKNVDIGDSSKFADLVALLKEHHILPIKSDAVDFDTDAKFLSNPIDQSQAQTLADELNYAIHLVSRVPDFGSDSFSQSVGEPALRLKLKPFLDLAKEKERCFTPALKKIIKLAYAFLEYGKGKVYSKVSGVDLDQLDISYSHDLPSNDQNMVTQIVNLNSANMLNPRIALGQLSWIKNVDEYLAGIVEKKIATSGIDNKNASGNNNGINPTNLERQNDKPQTEEQKDNLENFNNGNANRLDNK